MATTDNNTTVSPTAYRIATHTCMSGTTLYSIALIMDDGSEASVGRMLRTTAGVKAQKGVAEQLMGLAEVEA